MAILLAGTGLALGLEPGASSVALIWLTGADVMVCLGMLLALEIQIRGWAGDPL
jgi:hypothetical protein